LQLDRLHYQQPHWQSAGRLRSLPVGAVLAEFPEWSEALAVQGNGESLRLNGEWEIGVAMRRQLCQQASRTTLPSDAHPAMARSWRSDDRQLAAGSRRGHA
jgi:hypothetical protein